MTKQINLETREIQLTGRDASGMITSRPFEFDFRRELLQIMEAPSPRGQGGTKPGDMFKRLAVIGKLKAAEGKDVVILDDDEHGLIQGDLDATEFRIIDQAIVDLQTAVKEAEEVEITEVEKKEKETA